MDVTALLSDIGVKFNRGAKGWRVDSGIAAIYDPMTSEMQSWAENELSRRIPRVYVEFLNSTNGLYLNDLKLFGVAPSLSKGKGLNRHQLEPLSLAEANKTWRVNYDVAPSLFMIGYIEGWDENVGLFMDEQGAVFEVSKGGIGQATSIDELLRRFGGSP